MPRECTGYADDWSAFVDGELAAPRELELRAHLERCAECTARVEALRAVDASLAGLPAPAARSDLRRRLQVRIEAGEGDAAPASGALPGRSAPAPRRRGLSAALAAAVAVAAAVALYLATPTGRSPAPSPPTPAASVASTPELPAADEFDAVPVEDLAVASELDTIQDLGVIANLELLEMLVAVEEEGTG
jgi:anti-sigma factor RsiW